MYLLIISILLWIITILYSRRYDGYFLVPGVVFSTILLVSQCVYYYLYSYPISDYLRIAAYDYTYNPTVYIMHQIYMLACFASLIKLNASRQKRKKLDFSSIQKRFSSIKLTKTTIVAYYFLFCLLCLITYKHISEINIDLFLQNNEYHLLKDADELGFTTITRIIHFFSGIIAIFVLMIIILLFRSKLYLLGIGLLPFFLYFLSLKLAANSRWGPLIIASAIPILYKPKRLLSSLAIIFTGSTAFVFYLGALYGRNAYNGQGLIPLFSNVRAGIENFAYFVPKLLATAFASAWNLNLSLQRYSSEHVFYELKYKILVFSPLVAAIDGYTDELKEANILKIHTYAPVNFMAELYFFGWQYMIGFLIFFVVFMRYINKTVIKYGILGITASSTLYLFFLKMQQYPIRNSFRFLVISGIIVYLLNKFLKKK
jgi:hypothetical protein